MLKTQTIEYRDGDTVLEGYCTYDDKISGKRPAVLVAHDWSGRNEFACHKADKLAELGYVGFALDMYGKGKSVENRDEKAALMQPLIDDRVKLQKRITAAFSLVRDLPQVDATRIAAIGFCFGGLCVLDLARSGAQLRGAVSLHGLLNAPENLAPRKMVSQVLVLQGFSDPMVTPDQLTRFGEEMTHAKVDWQLHLYGNVMHGFTNPMANDPSFGTVYDKKADMRSWLETTEFLREVFE